MFAEFSIIKIVRGNVWLEKAAEKQLVRNGYKGMTNPYTCSRNIHARILRGKNGSANWFYVRENDTSRQTVAISFANT